MWLDEGRKDAPKIIVELSGSNPMDFGRLSAPGWSQGGLRETAALITITIDKWKITADKGKTTIETWIGW